jgi:hypothetical protein
MKQIDPHRCRAVLQNLDSDGAQVKCGWRLDKQNGKCTKQELKGGYFADPPYCTRYREYVGKAWMTLAQKIVSPINRPKATTDSLN